MIYQERNLQTLIDQVDDLVFWQNSASNYERRVGEQRRRLKEALEKRVSVARCACD